MTDKKIQEIRKMVELPYKRRTKYQYRLAIQALLTELDAKDTIIAEAYKQLANWTLDYVREDPGRVIINECVECRKIIDGWERGHHKGCEVGALMGTLSELLKKASEEANDG